MPSHQAKIYDKFDVSRSENIPLELRERDQWVCWKLEYREKDRASKIPVNPSTGRYADSADPKTWGKFSVALDRFLKSPGLQGVGFVFSENDPYTGVDFDDCIEPDQLGLLAWAKEWVEKLDTYAELSPSGRGIKLIVNGKPPGNLKRRNKIEMYSTKRFFTFTGLRYGSATEVRKAQRELDELYHFTFQQDDEIAAAPQPSPLADEKLKRVRAISDDDLLAMALKGKKFAALWEGSAAGYSDDLSAATAALVALLVYWTRGDAVRVEKLFRRSKLMRKKWDEKRESTTWGRKEIETAIARATKFYDPGSGLSVLLNDSYNSALFTSLNDQRFLYVDEWREWLAWNGVCWQRSADLTVLEATFAVQDELKERHAADLPKDRALATFVKQSGEAWRRRAMIDLARPAFKAPPERFDQDAMLFAVQNGVIDLRRGELREGKRSDFVTKQASVSYDPDARCANFEEFLLEIMSGQPELVDYLWRVIGYCLTGSYSERTFFLLQGVGRNGKSTFMSVLQALLGQYARTASISTFTKRQRASEAPRDDIAHLVGARLVVAQEADEDMVIDGALVKTLTGGDLFTTRELYGKLFQFRPAFKLFLVTNHMPRIRESATAFWDRMHYVKFNYRVSDEKQDKQLTVRLLAELPGILARAVRGATEWLDRGLDPPPNVLEAKVELQETSNVMEQALRELCVSGAGTRVGQAELYREYRKFAEREGVYRPMSAQSWNQRLREQGYDQVTIDGRKTWQNLGLKVEPKDEQRELTEEGIIHNDEKAKAKKRS